MKLILYATLAALGTLAGTRPATATITTFGCADVNVSCTASELSAGGWFSTGQFIFRSFNFSSFPIAGISVMPFEDGVTATGQPAIGGTPGGGLLQGFNLVVDPAFVGFDNPLAVSEVGSVALWALSYEVIAPVALDNINTAFRIGSGTTAGNGAIIALSTGAAAAACEFEVPGSVIPCDAEARGSAFFSQPAFTPFTVESLLSIHVLDSGGEGSPFVQVTGLSTGFREIPEPESLALVVAGLLGAAATKRRRLNVAEGV